MSNKGFTVSYAIVGIVIVAFVIVIGFLSLKVFGGNIIERILIFFPWYNNNQTQVGDLELFRYNIEENNVQYCDGVKCDNFINIGINEKKISSNELLRDFTERYYYNPELREKGKRFEVHPKIIERIYAPCSENLVCAQIPFVEACVTNYILVFQEGEEESDVIIRLIKDNADVCLSQAVGGVIKVDWKGSVEIRKVKRVTNANNEFTYELNQEYQLLFNQEVSNEMISIATQWRDSVLKTPMEVRYMIKDKLETIKVCVQKEGNKYLIADLSKKSESGKC